VDRVIALDKEWRALDFKVNELNKENNKHQKNISDKKKKQNELKRDADKERKAGKFTADDEEKLAAEIKRLEEEANELMKKWNVEKESLDKRVEEAANAREAKKAELHKLLSTVGNIVAEDVPISLDEAENKIIAVKGEKHAAQGQKLYHHELLYMIDGFEPDRGVAVAGHRAYFLKGPGVILNQALISYGLQFLMARKYTPLQPPFFMYAQRRPSDRVVLAPASLPILF
jgi:seryl-tRNA synthetase